MSDSTRSELIATLRLSQKFLAALLELTAEVQDWQPEPAEWSFRQIAAHLTTVERECYGPRVKGIGAGDHPHFGRYVHSGCDLDCCDLCQSLDRWQAERSKLLDFVASLPDDALWRTGEHEIHGTITTADVLRELVEHDQRQFRHVEQLIEDYLDEVNEGTNHV